MAERFVVKNLTKEPLPVLVPLNRLHCTHAVLPPEGKQEFTVNNVDIRAGHGTVGVLEKKEKVFIGEMGPVEEPAEKKAPKKAQPKTPAPAPAPVDAKSEDKDKKGIDKKKDKGKDK